MQELQQMSKLEKGIELIDKEQLDNDDTIESLNETINTLKLENHTLESHKRSARNVATNLKKLLGIVD